MDWQQINTIWLELNRPSADRLNAVLKRRGIQVSLENLRKFLKSRSEKEVFAARPVYKGRVYAADKDQRWAADIIDYTKNPSTVDGRTYTYILLVQDIFTRFAWAELMMSRDQAPDMFQRILERAKTEHHQAPTVLTTDEDSVFISYRFQAMLKKNDIVHVLKRSREELATIDRLIGQVRRALAIEVRAGASWAERVQQVISGHNKAPHRKLFNEAPADVSKPPETEHEKSTIFDLRYQAATDMKHNQDLIDKRKEKLQKARGFRSLLKVKRLNRRVYNEVWSTNVHLIKGFDVTGAHVQDTHEHWYATKDVLPTDTPEHEIPAAAQEQGEAPVEQEAVSEAQPPTPASRPSSAELSGNQRTELIRRWKAFYERGLPAGVRAAGVERLRTRAEAQAEQRQMELEQARRDSARNIERMAQRGETPKLRNLQRAIEDRIATLEGRPPVIDLEPPPKPPPKPPPPPPPPPERPFANLPMEELETRLRNARRDAAENEDHPRRSQEIRDLVRQYEEELQRRPMRPPEPKAPLPQPNKTFDREAIRDREYPLSKGPHRERKAFLERLRDNPLDATDEDRAANMAQELWARKNPKVEDEIDQFRMLLALRRAELMLGSPITIPITLDDMKNIKTLAGKQLLEDLKTRELKDVKEYDLSDPLYKSLNNAATALERKANPSDAEKAQIKVLREAHQLVLRRREAFQRRGG